MELTLASYIQGVKEGSLDADHIYGEHLQYAQQDKCNAFVSLTPEEGSQKRDRNTLPLAGATVVLKDNILTKGYRTTGASTMLEEYIAPYSATCYERLVEAGARLIGKANMDDSAMGSSSENSAFGPVLHPLDHSRVPGGSSGGSAVAVASGMCLGALGTDTGGSVRLPAALCGIVGFKPTYGRISRYGVIAMASSFDQIGTLTKTVEDTVLLTAAMSGHDPRDATSAQRPESEIKERYDVLHTKDLNGMRIAVPYEFFGEGLDPKIDKMLRDIMKQLEEKGATIERLHLPILQAGISVYYILVPAEVATNFAKFDGVRFGVQEDTSASASIFDYYKKVRDIGLGEEVKRRIMIGNYVLSAGYYDAYYRKAQLVRQKLINELNSVYEKYDLILGPTSPTVARKLGEKTDDPVQMYLMDVYTVIANLAGTPAISLPAGTIKTEGVDLPVGIQLMAKQRNESALFKAGSVIETLPKAAL